MKRNFEIYVLHGNSDYIFIKDVNKNKTHSYSNLYGILDFNGNYEVGMHSKNAGNVNYDDVTELCIDIMKIEASGDENITGASLYGIQNINDGDVISYDVVTIDGTYKWGEAWTNEKCRERHKNSILLDAILVKMCAIEFDTEKPEEYKGVIECKIGDYDWYVGDNVFKTKEDGEKFLTEIIRKSYNIQ